MNKSITKLENFLQAIDTLTIHFALAAVLLPLLAFVINVCLPGKANKAGGLGIYAGHFSKLRFSVFVFSKVWNQHQVHQQQLWFTIGRY